MFSILGRMMRKRTVWPLVNKTGEPACHCKALLVVTEGVVKFRPPPITGILCGQCHCHAAEQQHKNDLFHMKWILIDKLFCF
jgi:hypothetical protein